MLTGAELNRLAGNKWKTSFSPTDVLKVFDAQGPCRAIVSASQFCLTWFVEETFCNKQGKPLKLEAFQSVMLNMLWYKKFPMVLASRGAGKSFILALYALLKAILVPGSKIVICGAGYRQAKLVFKYVEELYESSPLIREALRQWGGPKYGSDAATLRVGKSLITAIPIGDGEKIRGLRATCLIADEFGSIPEEIFEIVLSPFTAVHANPAERAMIERFKTRLANLGADPQILEAIEDSQGFGNQVIISGTGSYRWNHFFKRYQVNKMFIDSKGDPKKLKRALEQSTMASTGKAADIEVADIERMVKMWKHYAIYQLPYHALPAGFLDEDMIRSDRAKFPKHRFDMEYLAKFPDDSDGFIKRSQVELATPKAPEQKPVEIELYGDPRATYVMGLDPARWNDNFGCVVLKLTDRGRELVYCTAWDSTQYSVSAKKIREICKRFNIQYIAMDAGGGGASVIEWLYKKQDGVEDSELLWPIPDQIEKYATRDAMGAPGTKMVEMVNFAPAWTAEAAHNLVASVEQQNLLFPYKGDDDSVINQYMRHFQEDSVNDRIVELLNQDLRGIDEWDADRMTIDSKRSGGNIEYRATLGISQHIDECINETCAIIRNVTTGGTEQFMLPKLSEQPEGLDMRRRDRFSALMLANYAAKVFQGHGHKPSNRPGTTSGYASNKRTRTSRIVKSRGSVRW